MEEKIIKLGYARVSTDHQDLEPQINALLKAGVKEENILKEKRTGKYKAEGWDEKKERPKYYELKQKIENYREVNKDIIIEVYVYKLDRIYRNFDALRKEFITLTQDYNCKLYVTSMPLFNDMYGNNLTTKVMQSVIIDMLGWVSECERAFMHDRQEIGNQNKREGKSGKSKSTKPMGQPEITEKSFKNWDEVYNKWKAKEITAKKACEQLKYQTSDGKEKSIGRSKFYELDRKILGIKIEFPPEWKDEYYKDWKAGKIRSVPFGDDNKDRKMVYAKYEEGELITGGTIPIPQGKFFKLCKQFEQEQKNKKKG